MHRRMNNHTPLILWNGDGVWLDCISRLPPGLVGGFINETTFINEAPNANIPISNCRRNAREFAFNSKANYIASSPEYACISNQDFLQLLK
jgi:hypothetical protein